MSYPAYVFLWLPGNVELCFPDNDGIILLEWDGIDKLCLLLATTDRWHCFTDTQQLSAEIIIRIKKNMEDPNEDTGWNDVLRRFCLIPPKQEEKDEVNEMILQMQKEAAAKPYEKMTLEALHETEDIFQEEERAIETYRQNRLKELKSLQKRQIFGELVEIPGNLYVREVTNAKEDVWVVLHLYRSCVWTCVLLNQHLEILANKFPETKFLKVIVDSCIAEYENRCLPTLLIYRNGQVKGEFTAFRGYGKLEDLEWKLSEVGAVTSDMNEAPKQKIEDMMMYSAKRSSIH